MTPKTNMKKVKAWIALQNTPRGWVHCPIINPYVYTSRASLVKELKGREYYKIVSCTISYSLPTKPKT